jgi:FKBP-type peptidyl-prolyl cis-trans isomerase
MRVGLRNLSVAALSWIAVASCRNPPEDTKQTKSPVTKASAAAAGTGAAEVVFNPTNPPPGWKLCHRNHCHHEDGRVASYQQVMAEIGATRIVGGEVPKAAPPAPPDVSSAPEDALKTPSGVASKVLKEGTGTRKPAVTSVVTVHYTGWTTDGKAFDSSVARGQPAQFPLGRVIPGWTEGLQLMVEGEERRLWIPESLAYKGAPGKPAGTLVFDVELLSIRD